MLLHYISITKRAKEYNCLYQNDVPVLCWMLSEQRKGKTGEVLREVKKWCMCACILYTACKGTKQSVEDGNFLRIVIVCAGLTSWKTL